MCYKLSAQEGQTVSLANKPVWVEGGQLAEQLGEIAAPYEIARHAVYVTVKL